MNMPPDQRESESSLGVKTKIALFLAAVFFIATAFLLVTDRSATLMAVCAGMTVTTLLHGLLGGVEGSFLKLKRFKASGSVAVFVAVTAFVHYGFREDNPDIQPNPESWIAIDDRGKQVEVKIGGKPYEQEEMSKFLSGVAWGVELENKTIRVTNGDDSLGEIPFASLDKLGIFDRVKMSSGKDIRFTGPLPAGTEADLQPLYSYRILTGQYFDNYNDFSVLDKDNKVIFKANPPLRTKQLQFFEHQGDHFMIFVSRAVHNDLQDKPWAVFGFAQVKPTVNWLNNSD